MASKTDLVDGVSKAVGITKTDTLQVVNSVFSELGNLIISQGTVQIPDFGKFVAKVMPQRNGRNPRTGEAIVISAKTRVRFSPFKTLEDAVAEAWPVPESSQPASTPPLAETPQGDVGTMRAKGVKAKAAGTKPKVKVKAVSAVSKPTPTPKKAPKKPKVKPIGYRVGKR